MSQVAHESPGTQRGQPDDAGLIAESCRAPERFGVVFNNLFTLANMPIQRFGAILLSQGQFDGYLRTLQHAHREGWNNTI